MSRFDYVKFDEKTAKIQADFKAVFVALESGLDQFPSSREIALTMTKLEEAYAWLGKAIRNEQIKRTGSTELQEKRADS